MDKLGRILVIASCVGTFKSCSAALPPASENTVDPVQRTWGSCVKYDPSAGSGACEDFSAKFVWQFSGTNIVNQENLIQDGLDNAELMFPDHATNNEQEECLEVLQEQICAAAMPPCFIDYENDGEEAPMQICHVACDAMWKKCGKYLRAFSELDEGRFEKFVPKCNDVVGDASKKHTYFYLNYVQEWDNKKMFSENNQETQFHRDDDHFHAPCWGTHLIEELEHEEENFWEDPYIDQDEFEEECLESGGQFMEETDPAGQTYYECIYTTRESCVNNGGEWVPVHDDSSTITYECAFPHWDTYYSEEVYDTALAGKWNVPTVEIGTQAIMIDSSTYLLPVPLVLKCEAGGDIIVSYKRNPSCSNFEDPNCLPDPTWKNVQLGLADYYPPGSHFTIIRDGYHVAKLRTAGRGKNPSETFILEFQVVRETDNTDLYLPPEDSDLVYVRSEVLIAVSNPYRFDTYSFSLAMVEALNGDLGTSLTVDSVIIREVEEDRVHFEIRVASADEAVIVARLKDPLFVYPLAERLYGYGLINATDSCAAASSIRVNTDAFESLSALTGTNQVVIIAAVSCVVLVFCIGGIFITYKLRHIKRRQDALDIQQNNVDKKEADLEKREKELESKLEEINAQEQKLLEEKTKLSQEQEKLEQEALEAEQQKQELEQRELEEIDPEGAEQLVELEKKADEELLHEAKSKLDELKEKFKDVAPSKEADEVQQSISMGSLAFLLKAPKRKAKTIIGGGGVSDVEKLKAFGEKMQVEEDKTAYIKLIDELVKKGVIKDELADEQNKVKREYEMALQQLENDMRSKKEEQRKKLAERRKKRLDLVMADAEQGEADAQAVEKALEQAESSENDQAIEAIVNPELVKEIEEELNEDFERQKALMKAQAPSQEDFDAAIAKLEAQKAEKKKKQVEAIARRRAQVRDKLQANEEKMKKEREIAEKRQREIAEKVGAVFKKISSVDNKVSQLKTEAQQAQAQLEANIQEEKERQRQKLLARKKKKQKDKAKVSPDDA